MQFTGGYYALRETLIRSSMHKHSAADPKCVSDRALHGINVVQATPWRINGPIASLLEQVWASGSSLGGLPPVDDDPVPAAVSSEEYQAMTRDELHAFKASRAEAHGRNDSYRNKRAALMRKLATAKRMKSEPAIYMPHFVDFRGRVYPMPQDLNPQGDDTSKALLEFGLSRPLGPNGLDWLAVKLAGTAGQDKLSYDDRIRWVNAHLDEIEDSVDDPLDGARFWASEDFDEPWSFLATAFEFVNAMRSPDHRQYNARQPIPLDGSTNGLQHLSLMGRDETGAVATNCSAHPERHDLYQQVADRVIDLVMADAIDGLPVARIWMDRGIKRATVKRAVMTTPYGVTPKGIQDQLISDGFCAGMGMSSAANAAYLRDCIVQGLSQTVSAAKEIMAYFQGCAGHLAEHNLPLTWTTPIGSRVTQGYQQMNAVRIRTLLGRIQLLEEDAFRANVKKQRLAAAPNIVHSFDASMLLETVCRMHDAGADCFAMIHDSYGVHPDLTDDLVRTLREVAYETYTEDWLDKLDQEFRSQAPVPSELPDLPARGNFDVSEVLASPYFFS